MFSYKIFRLDNGVMLTIADDNIIGKTFSDGDLKIEISKEFYSDKKCNENDAKELLKSATIVNAVGKKIVNLMVEEGIADKKNILFIKGIPHAQVIKI